MDFYLVRHGEAVAESVDPRRPLSDRGRAEVERAAEAAVARGVRVQQILHSDKLRARQTAEILARSLAPRRGILETRGLAPEDDPLVAKAELDWAAEPLMLVGHLPHLGRLAGLLVTGDQDREVVSFPGAAIACLSRDAGIWRVMWTLVPEAG